MLLEDYIFFELTVLQTVILDEVFDASVQFYLIGVCPEGLFDLKLFALRLDINLEVSQLNFILLQASCRLLENGKSSLCLFSKSVLLDLFRHV